MKKGSIRVPRSALGEVPNRHGLAGVGTCRKEEQNKPNNNYVYTTTQLETTLIYISIQYIPYLDTHAKLNVRNATITVETSASNLV